MLYSWNRGARARESMWQEQEHAWMWHPTCKEADALPLMTGVQASDVAEAAV